MQARILIVAAFLLAVIAIVAFTFFGGGKGPSTDATVSSGAGPQDAPKPGVSISMLYSTEKKEWIEAAKVKFQAAHPEIDLQLEGMGSLAAEQAILDGKKQPTVWSPADSLVLNMALADWDTKYHTPLVGTGADAPQPLLISPLVFAVWEDRAEVLKKNAGGANLTWKSIHTAVASNQGWPAIGGKPEWGFVKLGHTDPTQSNSGIQALLLMTMEFYGKTTGLTVNDILAPDYQKFIAETEAGVPRFEASTGTFMTDMVRFGPSKYDIAVVYENLAISQLANAQGRWGNLVVEYPATTLWSDHPVALLTGDWVTPEQAAAARTWITFLESRPMQEQALTWGFRPADPAVALKTTDANNPFVKFASQGVKVEIPPVATPPDAAVVQNVMTMWGRVVKH